MSTDPSHLTQCRPLPAEVWFHVLAYCHTDHVQRFGRLAQTCRFLWNVVQSYYRDQLTHLVRSTSNLRQVPGARAALGYTTLYDTQFAQQYINNTARIIARGDFTARMRTAMVRTLRPKPVYEIMSDPRMRCIEYASVGSFAVFRRSAVTYHELILRTGRITRYPTSIQRSNPLAKQFNSLHDTWMHIHTSLQEWPVSKTAVGYGIVDLFRAYRLRRLYLGSDVAYTYQLVMQPSRPRRSGHSKQTKRSTQSNKLNPYIDGLVMITSRRGGQSNTRKAMSNSLPEAWEGCNEQNIGCITSDGIFYASAEYVRDTNHHTALAEIFRKCRSGPARRRNLLDMVASTAICLLCGTDLNSALTIRRGLCLACGRRSTDIVVVASDIKTSSEPAKKYPG